MSGGIPRREPVTLKALDAVIDAATAATAEPATTPRTRDNSKQAQVIEMLKRPEGATLHSEAFKNAAVIDLCTRKTSAQAAAQKQMDIGFIFLLFLTSTTGLLLASSHESSSMPLLLSLHLGAVMALFLTLPYGKFAHGIFRLAALIRFETEKRLPSNIGLSGE